MILRSILYLAILAAFAFTAWTHNVVAGVMAGSTGLFMSLYFREVDFADDLMYVRDNLPSNGDDKQ